MVSIQCGTVKFQQIQAVIFDKDGTLADSQAFLRNLGQKRARIIDARIPGVQDPLLMAFGLESDRLNLSGLLAIGTRYENEIAAAAYVAETGRDWLESLAIVRAAFEEADRVFKRKADHTPLFEDGLSLLKTFASAGLKLAVLSSDTQNHVQDFVQKYELDALIQVSMGAIAGVSKPDPQLFLQVSQGLGVEPESILVIGDSEVDIATAKAACAAGCIGVTWGGVPAAVLNRADAIAACAAQIQVLDAIAG